MIKVDNLSKSYGSIEAVKSLSFEINDGEIVGFLGANGAGKSTTLKVMTGFLSPTSGNVYVDDLNILDHERDIQKRIGYLPELNPLYVDMKVFDLLKFHASVRGMDDKHFRTALERVVHDCGLSGVIHRNVGDCSKGYKQRIGLAAAMIHDPEVLILDEPVTGLDPNQIVEIRQLIKQLGKEKLVIMSSHILQEIQATVDKIIIIDNGELVAEGSSEELIASAQGLAQLKLELTGATEEGIQEMKAFIPSLSIHTLESSEKSSFVTLEYANTSDPRKEIFDYAVKNQWSILEMSQSKTNLEDVFRSLTQKGDQGNA